MTVKMAMISAFLFTLVFFIHAPAHAACTNPAGVAGEEMYNSSRNILEYCNGENWVAMVCNNEGGVLPVDCALPWGGTIPDSDTVTAYQSATVPFGGSCTSETRSCSNGALSGTYANQNCSVTPPADCSAPWGGTVTHGNDVTAYQNATEPFGGSCTSETRSCTNGALSGSYTNQNCTVDPADTTPDAFTFSDQTGVPLSSLRYSNTITISGINAPTPVSISGTGSPRFSINGGSYVTSGTITNGQTLRLRLTSSSSYNTTLGATINVGGVTDNWTVRTESAPSAGCSLPWGGSISHGQSRTAYLYSNQSCGISQTGICNNGSLSGSYTNQSCSVPACTTIGQTCADGTVYVGGGLYTTPSDSGNQNWYNAETTCTNLNAYSHSDWYLPSLSELNQLYSNRISIGGFNTTGSYPLGWYWSSSSSSGTQATMKKFSDGFEVLNEKTNVFPFRCVRR